MSEQPSTQPSTSGMDEYKEDAEKISKILNFPDLDFLETSLRSFSYIDREKRMQMVMHGFFNEIDSSAEIGELQKDAQLVKDIFPNVGLKPISDMLEEVATEENRVRLVVRRLLNQKSRSADATTSTTVNDTGNAVGKLDKRSKRKRGRKLPYSKMYHELRVKERRIQNLSPMGKILYNKMIHYKKIGIKNINPTRHIQLASKLVKTKLFKQIMLNHNKDVRMAMEPISFLRLW